MSDSARAIIRGRALGRAAAFLSVLIVLFVWYSFQDRSKLVRTDRTHASIESVKEMGLHLRLASGETVLIAVPQGVPVKAGERIPVRIETYESGKRIVLFDKERWAAGGG